MKVVAINGSARKEGNTTILVQKVFDIEEMVVPGSSYWNFAVGLHPGDVEKDEEGMKTMEDLGKNMAWLLRKIRG